MARNPKQQQVVLVRLGVVEVEIVIANVTAEAGAAQLTGFGPAGTRLRAATEIAAETMDATASVPLSPSAAIATSAAASAAIAAASAAIAAAKAVNIVASVPAALQIVAEILLTI